MTSREFEPVDADLEPYGVVSIASSAGGVVALGKVLGGLPADLAVPVLVVQHLDPRHKTVIADVLGRRARLNVKLADNGERVEAGTVYVAPPNRHLLVGRDFTACTPIAPSLPEPVSTHAIARAP